MTEFTPVLAPDAADRLILTEARGLIEGEIVVIGDASGQLALGALAEGASSVRLHQDSAADDLAADPRIHGGKLDAALLAGARLVLLRLPKALDALEHIARVIAANAEPDVVVVAGGRLKYMTVAMNEVLLRSFGRLDVSLARQKSRVLIAREPLPGAAPAPRRRFHPEHDLWVGAVGGVFAGTSIDIGTRAMLASFDRLPAYATAIDLGCGTGILAVELARRAPAARVIASDASAVAVASARETMAANGVGVEVVRDAGLSAQPAASADLIVLNPPFHDGGAVSTDIAIELFRQAARVLRPGGELWTVWNSHLGYRPALTRIIGPTREVSRGAKFTVTASTRSSARLGSGDPSLDHEVQEN